MSVVHGLARPALYAKVAGEPVGNAGLVLSGHGCFFIGNSCRRECPPALSAIRWL